MKTAKEKQSGSLLQYLNQHWGPEKALRKWYPPASSSYPALMKDRSTNPSTLLCAKEKKTKKKLEEKFHQSEAIKFDKDIS
jgi:hypothetical protein